MNIFVSWSGEFSKNIAVCLHSILPQMIPGTIPFISSESIEKGNDWFKSLTNQLNETRVCLVLLTPDNSTSPWLHFEAGIVYSKHNDAIMPIWCDDSAPNIRAPFSHFQHTLFTKSDWHVLASRLNGLLTKPHDPKLIEYAVNIHWEELHSTLRIYGSATSVSNPSAIATTIEQQRPDLTNLSPAAHSLLETLKGSHSKEILAYEVGTEFVIQIDDREVACTDSNNHDLVAAICELEKRTLIKGYMGRRDLFTLVTS